MATTITLDHQSGDVVILGPDGRRVGGSIQAADVSPARRGDLLREIGSGGPSILAGIIVGDEEHNNKLRGVDGVLIFDKMRRSDAQVAAVLAALTLPIQSAEPIIDRPESEDGKKVTDEHLDFARENLFRNIDFADVLSHALSSFWAGYAWFEKVYRVQDSRLVLDRLAPRLASTLWRWEADERGNLAGVTQRVRVGGRTSEVTLPRNKVALFTVGKEAGDYGGRSILRPAYKHYTIKDTLYKLEAIRYERFAIGVPVVHLPEQYSDDQKAMAEDIGRNWRGAEQSLVVLVGEMTIDLLQVKGSESLDIQPAIRHHNEEIAKSVLAQFINLGTSETGSRALGESMMEFFYDAIEGHAKNVASQINHEVLWPTMDLNFADKPRPELRFEDLGSVSLSQLATGLAQLKDFLSPDNETENYVRRRFGLPMRASDENGALDDSIDPAEPDEPEAPAEAHHDHSGVRLGASAFWRELREPEKFVRLRQIDARLEDGKDAIVIELLALREDIANSLAGQISLQWAAGPKGFAGIHIGVELLARAAMAITPEMEALYQFGREQVVEELQRQARSQGRELSRKAGNIRERTIVRAQIQGESGLPSGLASALQLRDEGLTPEEVRELARFRAGELVTRLMRKTQDAALSIAAGRWRTQGGTSLTADVLDEILAAVFDSVEREARLTANMTASEMLNLGRDFEHRRFQDQIRIVQYSSVLDHAACQPCRDADGEEFQAVSEEYYDLLPPLRSSRFGTCAGMDQCRCIHVAILAA